MTVDYIILSIVLILHQQLEYGHRLLELSQTVSPSVDVACLPANLAKDNASRFKRASCFKCFGN